MAAGVPSSGGGGGITFNNAIWKYQYNGQSYNTLEEAQAAAAAPNPAFGQTMGPTNNVGYQDPVSGQTIQLPAVVTGGGSGSLGSLSRASSTGGSSAYDAANAERVRLANLQAERDRLDAATATQARMMAYIAPMLAPASAPSGGASNTGAADAQSAAFARAKDQTADLARSSLMSLRAAAAERGVNVAGGTNPALVATEGRLMSEANKPLANLTRQQAIDTSARAADVEDRNYEGNIALAGQRAQMAPSLLSLLKVGGLY